MKLKEKFNLTGKCAIVTGASQGLGLAMAKSLAEFGCNIVIADINESNSKKVIKELEEVYEVRAMFIKVDITKENQVKELVKKTINEFGEIDILLNNAGVANVENAENMTYESWKNVIEINLNGVFLASKEVGKKMMLQKSGSIINISSMSGLIVNTPQNQCSYNTSKAGVIMLTKSLAVEWANYNIRVNSIAPGYMNTEMNGKYLEGKPNTRQKWMELTPMSRFGEPEELGGLAVFLASDASSYITGSIYSVDGGYTSL